MPQPIAITEIAAWLDAEGETDPEERRATIRWVRFVCGHYRALRGEEIAAKMKKQAPKKAPSKGGRRR